MFQVPIIAVPNQYVSFNVDSVYWQLHVYQSINFMCADIAQNGVPIMTGIRCFSGTPLMPYPYMYEPDLGNFIFDSDGDWTNFGTSCNLYYLQAQEFADFMASVSVGI
jgi:hypothetical protein